MTCCNLFFAGLCLYVFDDILIYNPSWSEHLHHIRLVLDILRVNHLHVKQSKCSFGGRSVAYLSHIILTDG